MFFTKNHEWIDFRGEYAYVGISNIKLIGFTAIQEIVFNDPINFKKRGEVIASIRYKDYAVQILMPTTGTVVQINKTFSNKNLKSITHHLEKSGWIFSMMPSNPYDRGHLIPVRDYLSMTKKNFLNNVNSFHADSEKRNKSPLV